MTPQLDQILASIEVHLEQGLRISYGTPQAGVLVPFFELDDLPYLLLTERASALRKHSGQISFPGGKIEPGDISIVETALRETREEIGLDREDIEVIALFHDFRTPYYSAVTPVIGRIEYPTTFVKQESEIARILEVPIQDLLDPSIYHSEIWHHDGRDHTIHFYDWDQNGELHTIWGATAGVITQLLNIIRDRS